MADGNGAVLTREFVPEEYQKEAYLAPLLDKPWGKDVGAEVFKKLVNAESLIGKRPSIPARDAKPEELEKFFDQFREDKAENYEIPADKDAKAPRDEAFMKVVQKAFHDGKMSKAQAALFTKSFQDGLKSYSAERAKVDAAARAKADAEFDEVAKVALGEKNKDVLARVNAAIKEHVPAAYKGLVDKLPDKELVIMAGVIDAIMQKYVPADKLNGKGPSGSGGGAGDLESKRKEMRTLMADKSYENWQSPEHEATVAKVKALAKEMAELQKAA